MCDNIKIRSSLPTLSTLQIDVLWEAQASQIPTHLGVGVQSRPGLVLYKKIISEKHKICGTLDEF